MLDIFMWRITHNHSFSAVSLFYCYSFHFWNIWKRKAYLWFILFIIYYYILLLLLLFINRSSCAYYNGRLCCSSWSFSLVYFCPVYDWDRTDLLCCQLHQSGLLACLCHMSVICVTCLQSVSHACSLYHMYCL